jgi:hypothetical protein
MKKIILALLAMTTVGIANAQTPYILSGTTYTQDFDALAGGLPQGWRVDSLVNKNAGLGNNAISKFSSSAVSWGGSTSRGFKNVASGALLTSTATPADQAASTNRSLGIRQVSASGWDKKDSLASVSFNIANTTGLASFNLQFNIMSLHTGAKRYNNWIVQYGLGAAPTSFTTVSTTPSTVIIDSNFTNTAVTVNFGTALDNQNQQVWIRIMPSDTTKGSGTRPLVGIDNYNLTWSGLAVNNTPQITSLSPSNNAMNVPITTTDLMVTFDKTMSIGTGNVTIYNLTDVTNQVIAAGSCFTNGSGFTVTIPGVNLLNGKTYAVQYDSTCFKWTTFNGTGIYNNSTWSFMTIPPIAPPVNSLNETFTTCLAPALGAFTQTSELGSAQTWRCSAFGHNDAFAVSMNGGLTLGDNTDWLVSPTMNVSAMANPMLSFWAKRRFAGSTLKEVYVSANFTGDVTTATWSPLTITGFATLDTTGWNAFNNTSLMTYKAANFHFAFKYTATAAAASDELTIDDVTITDGPVSTSTIQLENMHVAVLGTANDGVLNIAIDANSSSNYSVRIMDVLGNTIYNGAINATIGKNKYSIHLPAVSNGIYVMTIGNATSKGSVKFTKQ